MKRFLYKLVLVLIPLFISGCFENPEQPLRLGINVWPGYQPLYLAQSRGDLKEEHVQLIEFASTSQVIQAYRNNLIDAAGTTLDEALLLIDSGEDLKIVLVMDISDGGDAIIGQKGIDDISKIVGKKVGVENNALGAYVMSRALEINNIDQEKITIISLDFNEQEQAFINKSVDAVVTFDPVRNNLLKKGGNKLFDSKEIPGEIVDVLIVRDQYLNNHLTQIKSLHKSWFKVLEFINAEPKAAAQKMGLRMHLNDKDALAAFDGLKFPSEQENYILVEQKPIPKLLISARKMSELMFKKKLLKNKVNPDVLF